MPKPLDWSTCVFCAKKPRRPAAGICDYPMSRSVNLGTFKHQRIQTTTQTLKLPICVQCGKAMQLRTVATIAFAFVAILLLSILFLVIDPVDAEKGESLTITHVFLMVLSFSSVLAIPVSVYLIRTSYGLCDFSLMGLGNAELTDPAAAKIQRREALKISRGHGGLRAVPEIRNLYIEGFASPLMFVIFPGGFVKLLPSSPNSNGNE